MAVLVTSWIVAVLVAMSLARLRTSGSSKIADVTFAESAKVSKLMTAVTVVFIANAVCDVTPFSVTVTVLSTAPA